MTRVSIVMPSYEQAAHLEAAIESVLAQTGPFDVELIVVDGGSADGTVDLLRALDDPRVTWTSEPDRGQTHAVNKGLARANGDLIGWLNSDDLYAPGALAAVVEAFAGRPDASWLVGRCTIVDEGGDEIRRAVTRYKDRLLRRYSYRRLLRENFVSQMAVFWRRDFGARVGPLDETLHYAMDYDLWLRMGAEAPPLVLDRVLAHFRFHAGSKSGAVDRGQFDEQYRVACRHLDGRPLTRLDHRLRVARTVWAYRALRLAGR